MEEDIIIAPQEGSQEDFLNSIADITIFGGAGGSGKSRCILMDSLKYIDDPKFFGCYVRKTSPQLLMSIWKESKEIYPLFGGIPNESKLVWSFPSGAELKFSYFDIEKHKNNYQGAELSAIYVDEGTQFTFDKIMYLKSRMRSKAKNKSFMKITCNPERSSWLHEWVSPFIFSHDQIEENGQVLLEKMKGCPDRVLSGRLRYFVIIADKLVSAWTKEELLEANPSIREEFIQTYTFIMGTIDDNPIMDEIEPTYRNDLDNLPRIDKLRLRYGRQNCHA